MFELYHILYIFFVAFATVLCYNACIWGRKTMKTTRIFDGIGPAELEQMRRCFSAVTRRYPAGASVLTYSGALQHICVVLSGSVQINSMDSEGNIHFVEALKKGDVFGELFSLPMASIVYTAMAKSACEVLFIQHDRAAHTCEKHCAHHERLMDNLFMLSAQKAQMLSMRIVLLSQKTLRQKLMLYLEYCAQEARADAFDLPMSLSELAEYLSADRSAMMRELARMRREGLIRSAARHFELLQAHRIH